MKFLIQSFSKPAVLRIMFWAFIFSLAGYPQVDNEFIPLKESFNLNKNSITRIAFTPTQGHGIVFKLTVQTGNPQDDPLYKALKVHINGLEIHSGDVRPHYRRQQIIFEVPATYFIQGRENEIVVKLPEPSPMDFPYVVPEIKTINYKFISPNIPIAFVTLDAEEQSSVTSGTINYVDFLKIFLMVFAGFLLCQMILHHLFYVGKPAVISVHNKLYFFATLLPVASYLFSITTTYEVLFPHVTLLWLILIALIIFLVFGVLFLGCVCPKWLAILIPLHSRGNVFVRQGFATFQQRLLSEITVSPLPVRSKLILLALFLMPIALYWWGIFTYSINIVFKDDLTLFSLIPRLDYANGFQEKMSVLLGHNNEHRMLFVNVATWWVYLITGEINFKLTAVIGSLSLAILLMLFYKMFSVIRYKAVFFLPVIFFVLSLNTWRVVIQPINPLSNYYVICFVGMALWYLCKPGNMLFILALFMAFLATFNQASGMLIFVPGQLYLLAQKKIKKGVIWFLFGALCLFCYLNDIQFGEASGFSKEADMTPLNFLGFYFAFLGSSLSLGKTILAIPVGLMGFVYFLYLTWKQYYFKNPVIYYFIFFIIIAGSAVAYGRTEFGVSSALSPRYQLNSVTLMVLLYLSALEIFLTATPDKKIIFTLYLTALMFCFQVFSVRENMLSVESLRLEYVKMMRLSFPIASLGERPGVGGDLLEALNKKRYFLPCDEMYPGKKIKHSWCK